MVVSVVFSLSSRSNSSSRGNSRGEQDTEGKYLSNDAPASGDSVVHALLEGPPSAAAVAAVEPSSES